MGKKKVGDAGALGAPNFFLFMKPDLGFAVVIIMLRVYTGNKAWHISSKFEVISRIIEFAPCDHCEYEGAEKGNLKKHMHEYHDCEGN